MEKQQKFKARQVFLILASVICLMASAVSAAVPTLINFQGRLLDSNKNPKSGLFQMTFSIYTVSTEGSPVWTETQNNIQVTNGMFSAQLGASTALVPGDFSAGTLWLEIQVGTEILSPRERLVASPYSFRSSVAESAVSAEGVTLGAVTDNGITGPITGSKIGSGVAAGNIANGALGTEVMASSVAYNSVRSGHFADLEIQDAKIAGISGSKVGSGVPAANVADGKLGAQVIVSSIADTCVLGDAVNISTGIVSVARGGTGISNVGGVANRVLVTTDGSAWSVGQVAPSTMLSASGSPGASTFLRGDNSWVSLTPTTVGFDPVTTVFLMEEFLGGLATTGNIGSLGWQLNTIGAALTYSGQVGVAGRPGIMRLLTSATINQGGSCSLANITATLLSAIPGSGMTIKFAAKITSAANVQATIRIGIMTDPTNAQPASGTYFELIQGAAAGSWYGTCRNAAAQTQTVASWAADANWHYFQIRQDGVQSVWFSVDGGAESQVTGANVTSAGCQPCIRIVNTIAAAKSIDMDYYCLTITGLTR